MRAGSGRRRLEVPDVDGAEPVPSRNGLRVSAFRVIWLNGCGMNRHGCLPSNSTPSTVGARRARAPV